MCPQEIPEDIFVGSKIELVQFQSAHPMAPTPNPIGVIRKVIEVENTVGDFIANGPSTGLPGFVRDQYRKRCDQFANAPAWARALANAPSGSLGRICQPWYDSQGKDGPTKEPDFTGGQCPVFYSITHTIQNAGVFCGEQPAPVTNTTNGVLGPIGPVVGRNGPTGGANVCPGFTAENQTVTDGNGNIRVLGGSAFGSRLVSISVSRQDGQPDDCGDPPAELEPGPDPPPDPGPTDAPDPTEDPNNPTGPPLLPIPIYVDPIGGPTEIEAEPEPSGGPAGVSDIPGDADTQPGGPENVGDPISVDPGPGGGGEETDFGPPPDGRSWVGCLLQLAIPDGYGNIAGSGPGNTVVPRVVGNLSLVYEGGRGTADRINSEWVQAFRPVGSLKVTGVYVNVEPGITYTVRPVSIENCPENSCSSGE